MSPILDRIFSHRGLDQLDRDALVRRYDVSSAIHAIKSDIRSQRGQIPQEGPTISEIPPEGIVISSPGTYSFAGDVAWHPGSTAGSAITITAGDVVLDMAGHRLVATVQDRSQLIVGITIPADPSTGDVSNVTIRNGTLADMCFYGICAEHVENLTVENVTVSGVTFHNLDVRNLCPAGIHVDHGKNVALRGCTVQSLDVTADSSAGIQMLHASGTVTGCRMSEFTNHDGSVQGFSYLVSSGITTSDCTAERFQSHFNGNTRTAGHTVLGFVPILCADLHFEDCTATNMTGCCDDCHGMSVFIDAFVRVTNFTATSVVDGVTPTNSGAKATGLEVYGGSVSVENCSVSGIRAIRPQDRQATGFSAWGAMIRFTGCTATDVVVTDENGRRDPEWGFGTGFGWAPDPRWEFRDGPALAVAYTDCSAVDCQVGFDTWYHVDSRWTNVSYASCEIGILVEPEGTRTLSCDACSECDPPITVVLTNIARGNVYPGSSRGGCLLGLFRAAFPWWRSGP